MSEDKSLTLAANANDQVLFAPDTAHTLKAEGHDASEDGTGRGVPVVAFAQNQLGEIRTGEVTNTLNTNSNASGRNTPMVAQAFNWQSGGDCRGLDPQDVAGALTKEQTPASITGMAVRRLTPRECERLQGFPDDYTLIPWRKAKAEDCPDGPRYKALGNSMAVPVMRWIGERISSVEQIINSNP